LTTDLFLGVCTNVVGTERRACRCRKRNWYIDQVIVTFSSLFKVVVVVVVVVKGKPAVKPIGDNEKHIKELAAAVYASKLVSYVAKQLRNVSSNDFSLSLSLSLPDMRKALC
jgi:6-phosphogluconate dehydrogenase